MNKMQNTSLEGLSTLDLESLLKEELAKEPKDFTLIQQILENLKAQSSTLPTVSQEEVDEVRLRLQETKTVPPAYEHPRNWKRKFAVAAAVLCLVILVIPFASGANFVQELIAKWNDKIFWIESPGTPVEPPEDYVFQTDNPGLQQLYDAVTELGITAPVVPMWLPDGFVLGFFDISLTEGGTKITASFQNDDNEIAIYIERKRVLETDTYKNATDPQPWVFNGVKHYYVENKNRSTVIWLNTNYEASVSAPLSKTILYRITKSIYYGKEE